MEQSIIAFFLCLFLGWMGAHRFYQKKNKTAVLYLFTVGLFCIGWLVDTICLFINMCISIRAAWAASAANSPLVKFDAQARPESVDISVISDQQIDSAIHYALDRRYTSVESLSFYLNVPDSYANAIIKELQRLKIVSCQNCGGRYYRLMTLEDYVVKSMWPDNKPRWEIAT